VRGERRSDGLHSGTAAEHSFTVDLLQTFDRTATEGSFSVWLDQSAGSGSTVAVHRHHTVLDRTVLHQLHVRSRSRHWRLIPKAEEHATVERTVFQGRFGTRRRKQPTNALPNRQIVTIFQVGRVRVSCSSGRETDAVSGRRGRNVVNQAWSWSYLEKRCRGACSCSTSSRRCTRS
jgi:hypothetical protein